MVPIKNDSDAIFIVNFERHLGCEMDEMIVCYRSAIFAGCVWCSTCNTWIARATGFVWAHEGYSFVGCM